MLLLDSLLLAPGTAVMKIFEELARKAQEEFLDDGPVKKELQEIYAMLESGRLSETDFDSREQQLLQRLEQIARLKFALPEPHALPAEQEPDAEPFERAPEVLPPAPDFSAFDVPRVALPTLDLSPVALPRVEFPPLTPSPVIAPVAPPPVSIVAPAAPTPPIPVRAPAVVLVPEPPGQEPPAAVVAESPAEAPPVRLTPVQVVECALRGLAMLKMKVSTVTAVTRAASGWQVIVELIESRAVPDTSDLLGIYEVQLDESGNILGYVRTRLRRRCDLGGGR